MENERDSRMLVSAGRKITADDAPHGLDGGVWEIGIGKSAAVEVQLAGVRLVAVLRPDDDLIASGPEGECSWMPMSQTMNRVPSMSMGDRAASCFARVSKVWFTDQSCPLLASLTNASSVTTRTRAAWIRCSDILPDVK